MPNTCLQSIRHLDVAAGREEVKYAVFRAHEGFSLLAEVVDLDLIAGIVPTNIRLKNKLLGFAFVL